MRQNGPRRGFVPASLTEGLLTNFEKLSLASAAPDRSPGPPPLLAPSRAYITCSPLKAAPIHKPPRSALKSKKEGRKGRKKKKAAGGTHSDYIDRGGDIFFTLALQINPSQTEHDDAVRRVASCWFAGAGPAGPPASRGTLSFPLAGLLSRSLPRLRYNEI